ncbi:MAG: glutamine--fructose-6-phosphate transaminase (isomerizing) [Armatimonadota bacterium]
MCGIVGYIGTQEASGILVEGLRRLEYRGYDSAGVAILSEGRIAIARKQGKLERLAGELAERPLPGMLGIGHTRWATHGAPSDENAHPHRDCSGRFAVVHNGIIENYLALREQLEAEGHLFTSETDTEVLAHLLESLYQGDLYEAVRGALGLVQGSYALVAVSREHPDRLVAARQHSPLIVGHGEGQFFVASDVPAIIAHTRQVTYLKNGEIADISREGVRITSLDGAESASAVSTVAWDPVAAERGGFQHFMLKEIHEQPHAVAETLRGRLVVTYDAQGLSRPRGIEASPSNLALGDEPSGTVPPTGEREADSRGGTVPLIPSTGENAKAGAGSAGSGQSLSVTLPGLKLADHALRAVDKVLIVACGTAYHAGLVGKYLIERLARVPVEIDVASELRYREPIVSERTLAVVISQSGETADTLAGLREAKERGAHILAVTNVVGSSVDREADSVLYTYAGPEIAVASTKAYSTQLMVMYLLALRLGEVRGTLPAETRVKLIDGLQRIPEGLRAVLEGEEAVREFARKFHTAHSMLYLGRGVNFPTALEGALKLKEISYIHAEGYAAGEMKHGPIALITPDCPTVAVAVPGGVYEKMLSNIKEVKARRGYVLAIAAEDDTEIKKYADGVLPIPRADELLTPILAILPLQLLSYYCALELGLDIDQPRNLAKSVTVE